MRDDKQKALKLRLKGLSYNQIKEKLGIPKSTLSSWFKNLEISKEAREKIKKRHRKKSFKGLLKRNKLQTKKAKERAKKQREKSKKDIKKISKENLMILGAALYWGEGYKRLVRRNGIKKTAHPISLSNSDPKLIKWFIRFLEEVCDIDKKDMKVSVRIYNHMNKEKILEFWQKVTGIPKNNFKTRNYISSASKRKRSINRLPYGTAKVSVFNTQKFHKIMGWIEGLKELI
ncbi:MAG TPA: helix-turn-helix domain-containing protein [Candidatus Paceibacterota bacterium]|nr:helix-turn-helix domain-containing protein [Candidatus Paceibacterota bacterium]